MEKKKEQDVNRGFSEKTPTALAMIMKAIIVMENNGYAVEYADGKVAFTKK